jgi:hypothetical protein
MPILIPTSPNECQDYVLKAVQYICKLTAHLTAEEAATLLRTAHEARAAEAAVDAAARSGDVDATKEACRVWWNAWKVALREHKEGVTP